MSPLKDVPRPVSTDPAPNRRNARPVRASSEAVALGRLLAAHRVRRGLTQKRLSERTDLVPSVLARIECGHHEMSVKTLRRYLRGLGMTLDFRDVTGSRE